ncbi:MAG: Flp pilus assembly complex ATPase component TadA [Pseudomonadota bacterium]|nr:Flp pilus assembly complex ATPase component TadA [Pseudomonadota bacterium]MDO7710413.1 Flp pilus assembly complex ATPase component TadA [Pseudomonadota bacterium]
MLDNPEIIDKQRIVYTQLGTASYLAPLSSLSDETMQQLLLQRVDECIAIHEIELYIDFAEVPSVNSGSLEILLSCYNKIKSSGGRLHLINTNALVNEVLFMTGLNHYIDVVGNDKHTPKPHLGQPRQRLGDMLIAEGLLTKSQLENVMTMQLTTGKRLGALVVEKGWVSENDLNQLISLQLGIHFVQLRTGMFDLGIQKIIPLSILQRLKIVPLFKLQGQLFIATSEPLAIPILDEIYDRTGLNVTPVLASSLEILAHLQANHQDDYDLTSYLTDMNSDLEVVETYVNDDFNLVDEMASGSPIINLVNAIIQRAIRDGVSDVHIEPSRTKSRVRFRIDGILYEFMSQPAEMHPAIVSRLKVMANLDIAERRLPQDGRVQVNTQGRSIDLRFSSLPGIFGEKVVMRVLDKNQNMLNLDKLDLDANNLASLKKLLSNNHGLILATGPTGSGKTTTLYAALNHLNSIEKSIVTIEDPVEYQLDIINQNQVNDKIGLSFPTVLRHVLRQDPDIIMVGEIRDRQTAEIAVQAALTGHLVLSTLHTNESVGAITRLVEMGIEPYLLSSALIGVVAQRLIRTICPDCKTSYTAPSAIIEQFGWQDKAPVRLSYGRGCSNCYDSGYKGRMAVHEILICNAELQRLMTTNPSRDQLADYMKEAKVRSLFDDGLERVLAGKTTLDEVSRVLLAE